MEHVLVLSALAAPFLAAIADYAVTPYLLKGEDK
jgi:hypothetical protein